MVSCDFSLIGSICIRLQCYRLKSNTNDSAYEYERMSNLVERSVKVELDSGLQARPAALFVQEANHYTAHLFLEKDGKRVNAKSIMGLMSLAITTGEMITLMADGVDAEAALDRLTSFVSKQETEA